MSEPRPRLHDGMTESLDYALSLPGLTPQSRVVSLYLTDYEDNDSTPGSNETNL